MLGVLGLGELRALGEGDDEVADDHAHRLLEQRERARTERDFETADRLRDELRALGWEIRDGPAGPELIAASP
jgi:cysteinyl-tRNA synthetase